LEHWKQWNYLTKGIELFLWEKNHLVLLTNYVFILLLLLLLLLFFSAYLQNNLFSEVVDCSDPEQQSLLTKDVQVTEVEKADSNHSLSVENIPLVKEIDSKNAFPIFIESKIDTGVDLEISESKDFDYGILALLISSTFSADNKCNSDRDDHRVTDECEDPNDDNDVEEEIFDRDLDNIIYSSVKRNEEFSDKVVFFIFLILLNCKIFFHTEKKK
jgi:hypothetical protein